jgi:hypothetical protein
MITFLFGCSASFEHARSDESGLGNGLDRNASEYGPSVGSGLQLSAHNPMASLAIHPAQKSEVDPLAVAPWKAFFPLVSGGVPYSSYADASQGFAFEYPAAYDEPPMQGWGCGPQAGSADGKSYVFFGSDSQLVVSPAGGTMLEDYANLVMAQYGPEQYPTRDDERLRNHDPRGIVVQAIIMHHQIIRAFYLRGDTIYEFSTRPSLACMDPSRGIVNPYVWWHAVESFHFTR